MKSLDDLIRHLLEEIALCGDHGAGISDFIRYVNGYYGLKVESKVKSPSSSGQKTPSVDRKFLEKVWGWLARHPEIEVGENGWASELSLSEVEHRTGPTDDQRREALDNSPSAHQQHQDGSDATSPGMEESNASGHGTAATSNEQVPPHIRTNIRVYASIERRWQAIAGHAPDRDKIPRLDFACLSIIAAHKEQGVLQPDLITISGQDKRHSWTSKLVHTKYLEGSLQQEDDSGTANDSDVTLRPAKTSAEQPKDFLALQHKIFEVLREFKLITFVELKKRLGVTGLAWPKRLFASHLRRLESIGCIKQVRARPDIEATTPFLFRCVKYVRDPEGKEWQPIQYPSRNRSKDVAAEAIESDALPDDEQDYQLEEAQYLARNGGVHNLTEVGRQIPQWSGDSTLSNLLYDLIHAAGKRGMSTMEVKNRSVGCFNLRPTENHLSRLVERWQMSQPLHLRHLSIIRDAALTEGVPHYVHYSFENFQSLVDEGRASWESVMTITKDHKDFMATASVHAKPELDEDGFPKLPSNIFQGRHNDASLTECIQGADALALPRSNCDPKAVLLKDGTWDVSTGTRPYGMRVKVRNKESSSQDPANGTPLVLMKRPRKPRVQHSLVVSDAGRPRKVPREGLPPNFESNTPAVQRETYRLQGAARDYRKKKIVDEIGRQVAEGGDRYQTTASVLELAITQHHDAKQEPPWQIIEEVRVSALAPCLMALEFSRRLPALNFATRYPGQASVMGEYRPSAAAHGRPLRAIDLQLVEETLRRRILLLETIAIKEEIKSANAHILADAIREPHTKKPSPQPFYQFRPGKTFKGRKRPSTPAVNNRNSNDAVSPSLPNPGKKKSVQKKKSKGSTTDTGSIPMRYLPSVAAHTRPVTPKYLPTTATSQVKPVKRRQPKKKATAVSYLPSVAAHSWPVTPNKLISNLKSQPKQAKRKYTRKKSTAMPYLPSVAAHSWPVVHQTPKTRGTPSGKRKRAPAGPVQSKRKCDRKSNLTVGFGSTPTPTQWRISTGGFDNPQMPIEGIAHWYLPSVAAHTRMIVSHAPTIEEATPSKRKFESTGPAPNKRQKKVSWKAAQLGLGGDLSAPIAPTRLPPPSQRNEILTYEQQLANISRPVAGCYVGVQVKLAKPGQRGAKRKSQLAVFKSSRIQSLACLSGQMPFLDPAVQVQQAPRDMATNNMDSLPTAVPSRGTSLEPELQRFTHPPLPVVDSCPVQPHQGGELSNRWHSDLPEQSHNVVEPPSLLHHTPYSMPNAFSNMEHSAGVKRKRSIRDEARRESTPPRPVHMRHHQPMPSAYKNADAVNGQLEAPEEINENVPPHLIFVHNLSLSQDGGIADPMGEAGGPPAGSSQPAQAPIDLNAFTLDAAVVEAGQNEDDGSPGFQILAQSSTPSAPSNRCTEAITRINDSDSSEQQQAIGTPKVHETALCAPPEAADESPDNEPVSLDHEIIMRNILDDTALLHGIAANDPVASPDTISKSPQTQLPGHDLADGVDGMAGSNPFNPLLQGTGGLSETSPPPVIEHDLTTPKGRKGVRKMKPHGGSIAAQRQKIVMDIVERCGGIYPGTSALAVPFKEEWSKSGYSGRAETSTLSKVVQELCSNGQLRQVKFVIKDSRGIHITKSLITKVEMSTTDPRVSAMKNKVKRAHPSWYFPDELGYSNETHESYWNPKGPLKNRTVRDLELDDERVQLNEMPECILGYELKEKERQERLPARRRLASLAKKDKIDRLASRKKATTRAVDKNGREELARRQGIQKIRLRHSKDSLTFTQMLGIEDFENDFENLEAEERLHFEAVERIIATNTAEGIADESEEGVPLSKEPELRTFRLIDNELSSVGDPKQRKTWPSRRRSKAAPDPKAAPHSKAAILQMKTFMDPEHIFHPATGTFHTNFSVARTANQIRNIYHWQRPSPKNFHGMADDSERWALRQKGLEDVKFQNWPFISYPFPHPHRTSAALPRYSKRSRNTKRSGWQLSDETPDQQILAELAAAQSHQSRRGSASSSSSTVPLPPRPLIPAKRKKTAPTEQFMTRRLTSIDKLIQLTGPEPPKDTPMHEKLPDRRRGEKLNVDFTQRILTAVIVIRTLTGGVERHIDWVLVANAFRGEHGTLYLSKIWPKALQAHKVQAEMIRTRFAQLFLEAYQEGRIPLLDYDNLADYDWAWLVDWTLEHLDTPLEACLDLPLQRDKVEQVFDFRVGEDPGVSAYYEFCVGSARVERREAELHKKAWVQPLIDRKNAESAITDRKEFEVVKTWVRANIATKKNAFSPQFAWDKLARFDKKIRIQALGELHRDSVVIQLNKGRSMPGCQFGLSQKYLKPLKKKIEPSHLHQAAMFKREIDTSLANDGEMIIPQTAEDAFMLAVQNMQAHRRLSFVAKNPPMEKFGLGGVFNYRGRQIPKEKYLFDVALRAAGSYREGNPLLPLPEPPSISRTEADMEKIPLWYDIHGEVVEELWGMVVAAVMSILVTRPGISIYEVEPEVRPTLGSWEVQMVLDWMVEAKAAGKTGKGYVPEEWWWLCLDTGRTFEEDKELKEAERAKEMQQSTDLIRGDDEGVQMEEDV
ncbi:MAG: hypothetical protein Q9208_000431 [Pyrenodesmia sp. 3 TL-2023]